jgi:hypothetical protein
MAGVADRLGRELRPGRRGCDGAAIRSPAEDRRLEGLPAAVDIREADLLRSAAPIPDGGEDFARTVGRIDRNNLGSIGLGVVGPTTARRAVLSRLQLSRRGRYRIRGCQDCHVVASIHPDGVDEQPRSTVGASNHGGVATGSLPALGGQCVGSVGSLAFDGSTARTGAGPAAGLSWRYPNGRRAGSTFFRSGGRPGLTWRR